jgi:hypothetical protein
LKSYADLNYFYSNYMSASYSSCQTHSGQIHTPEEIAVFLHNFERNFEREKNAFRHLRPDSFADYKGQFVALRDGQIVDKDWNEIELAKRVSRMPQDRFILIKHINYTDKI